MRKITFTICFLLTYPILLSFDSNAYFSNYHAIYQSPEGITFLSYSDQWDEAKLSELYQELIKNKHSKEIYFLQEVRVMSGAPDHYQTANYHALTNTITLFNGDQKTEAAAFSETLSHEYGHHFAYYYFKSHHFPFSKWEELRGLKGKPVQWDAFWNYNVHSSHKWYPQEIFADDYVLLFGTTERANLKDIYTNEAFYLRTEHENQDISNILENTALHEYVEEVTGLAVDEDRLVKTPQLLKAEDGTLTFTITVKENVAYRLNLSTYHTDDYVELYQVTANLETEVSFKIDDHILDDEFIKISFDIVDLTTNIGFTTEEACLHVRANQFENKPCNF